MDNRDDHVYSGIYLVVEQVDSEFEDEEIQMNQSAAREIVRQDVGKSWLWLLEPVIEFDDMTVTPHSPNEIEEGMSDWVIPEYIPEKNDCENIVREGIVFLHRKGIDVGIGRVQKYHQFGVFLWTELYVVDFTNGMIAPYKNVKNIRFQGNLIYELKGRIFKRDRITLGG